MTSQNEPNLRKATNEDGPLVLWLEEICMKDYAIALWGKWRQSATLEEINLTGHQIIEFDSQAIGCVATTRQEGFLQVDKLYLGPDFRNRGIGAHVLRRIVKCDGHSSLPVRLSVLTTNPALKFYLREGFAVESETAERRFLVKKLNSDIIPAQ